MSDLLAYDRDYFRVRLLSAKLFGGAPTKNQYYTLAWFAKLRKET